MRAAIHRRRELAGGSLVRAILGVIFAAQSGAALAGAPASPVEPISCLLYNAEEIAAVRAAAHSDPAARAESAAVLDRSRRWVEMPEIDLERLIPPADAAFAYGFAGDPKTNEAWPRLGEGLCSLDRPGAVASPRTGDVYGLQKAGEPFSDDGQGWVRPSDGKKFYFKGIWNAFIVTALHSAVDSLAVSYMLTGDAKYSRRALEILDRLATLRSHRPRNDGPADWPNPPVANYAFFYYPGNNANVRMVASAFAFDLVGRAEFARAPSPTHPGLTVFENIRRNYFSIFERATYVDTRRSFFNHAVICYAAIAAEGLLFGRPDDIRTGIEACYGALDNTIDRDGEYHETSSEFDLLARRYQGLLLNLFRHYRPERYPGGAQFPRPEDYPYRLNFADHPAWYKMSVGALYSTTVLGRVPQYGDDRPDRFVPGRPPEDREPGSPELLRQKMASAKMIYHGTSRADWKRVCAALFGRIPEAFRNDPANIDQSVLEQGPSGWIAPGPAAGGAPPPEFDESRAMVAGQKRIALLRRGDGPRQRAVFIHGGSVNDHGHNDQMAVVYYADQLCLTGTYGYNLSGMPDNYGYGMHFVASASVIVDEDLPAKTAAPTSTARSRPPARIEGFLPFGPAQFLELSDPQLWPNSRLVDYRRQTWLIDVGKDEGCFLDLFWIEGGRTHDYLYEAPFLDPPDPAGFSLAGIDAAPIPGAWTLAGLNGDYRDADFNQPGKSWGERLATDGTIRNLPGERLPTRAWNPPPGNGYGFVYDLKGAATDRDWSATWRLHDHRHFFKLSMVNFDGQLVAAGKAPSRTLNCPFNLVVARRQAKGAAPLASRFATLSQVSSGRDWPVSEVEAIPGRGAVGDVALEMTHRDGTKDVILAAGPGRAEVGAGALRLRGRRAFIRRDAKGGLTDVVLSEGTLLEAGDFAVRLPAAGWAGKVGKVAADRIEIDAALPANGALRGHGAMFSSSPDAAVPYSSNEFFTIEDVAANSGRAVLSFVRQSVVAARVRVENKAADGIVTAYWPNEIAAIMVAPEDPSRMFDGHLLREAGTSDGGTAIVSYFGRRRLKVEHPDAIRDGKNYDLLAVQPSDRLFIPALASLRALPEGGWEIRANMDAALKFPGSGSRWSLRTSKGRWELEPDAGGFLHIAVDRLEDGVGTLALSR